MFVVFLQSRCPREVFLLFCLFGCLDPDNWSKYMVCLRNGICQAEHCLKNIQTSEEFRSWCGHSGCKKVCLITKGTIERVQLSSCCCLKQRLSLDLVLWFLLHRRNPTRKGAKVDKDRRRVVYSLGFMM